MSHTEALLTQLDQYADHGRVRHLGAAFARFLNALAPMPAAALLCCVIVSELEGQGHSCLLLSDFVDATGRQIGLSTDEWDSLAAIVAPLPKTILAWTQTLTDCTQVWTVDKAEANQPLALEHDRLYLRRFWRNEKSIAQAIAQRTANVRGVDPAQVSTWLERLFPSAAEQADHWQKTACAIAIRRTFSIITGGPGTGKTYTVARLLALLFALSPEPQRLRIAMAAPSGKAAVRLKQSIDQALRPLSDLAGTDLDLTGLTARLPAAKTLHSLLGFSPETRSLRYHADNLLEVDVLIVDEASMVNLEMMAFILDALPASAMLILLGDKDQLASVEAGAVLGDLCAGAEQGRYDASTAAYVAQTCRNALPDAMVAGGPLLAQQTVMLRKSRRFQGAIGQLALAVNRGDVAGVEECFTQASASELKWYRPAAQTDLLALALDGRNLNAGGYRPFLTLVRCGPSDKTVAAHAAWTKDVLTAFDTFRILCAVRAGEWGVDGVNNAVEQCLVREKLIDRRGEWYAGRPVMVTRNDYQAGVLNGDVGIALPDESASATLRVYFLSGEKVTSVLPTRLAHVDTAFAITVHKVQGSEFCHVVLALPPEAGPVIVRELIYTAITRASKYFTLLTPVTQVVEQGIRRRTVRSSGLQHFFGTT